MVVLNLLLLIHASFKFLQGKGVDLCTIALNSKGGTSTSHSAAGFYISTLYHSTDKSAPVGVSGTGGVNNLSGTVGGDFSSAAAVEDC